IELFEKNMANCLYISGLNADTSLKNVLKALKKEHLNTACVFYDFAKNTDENAKKTAEWIRKRQIKSVLLVTESLHMKRSLLLLSTESPSIRIIPYPVDRSFSNNKLNSFLLIFQEFLKFKYEAFHYILLKFSSY
ncbi:MAG: YdcF family protein, partial [Proteobacteria bacterium]|nr:YdcF family protein [Pseudomonadota bacterium]